MDENQTYIFDDGSTLTTAADGSVSATNATDMFYGAYSGDALEQKRLGTFQTAPAGKSWWEGLLQYGATKAIDSHYADQELQRLKSRYIAGVGFVGANGITQAPGVVANSLNNLIATPQRLMAVLALAGLGFVLLKK